MENEQVNILLKKLEAISQKNSLIENEIESLKNELNAIKNPSNVNQEAKIAQPIVLKTAFQSPLSTNTGLIQKVTTDLTDKVQNEIVTNWEKFIGENLINKIGILITIIGVGIGAKYSIDHDLISPSARIALGYLLGLGLLGFGIKLKVNYENFSAVLVSGAISIMYFITYAGYSFYGLFPQIIAFGMMVIFTIFGIIASLNYNKEIIALIGLVGAYSVPFLLSDGSGKIGTLFSYIAIINSGILFLSFKKFWKILYYSAYVITWLIVGLWVFNSYKPDIHLYLALLFTTLFFLIFYIIILAYISLKKESHEVLDILILLSNSLIYFGLGYFILNSTPKTQQFLGLFTVINGLIHFGVSKFIQRQDRIDKKIFYLILGLVLTFITIAIPVQLEGNWVTLLWTGEALALYWIGLKKEVSVYEKLSYILMGLAFFSLIQDWTFIQSDKIIPFFNVGFLSSLLFCVAFLYINYLRFNNKQTDLANKDFLNIAIPGILLVGVYFTFRIEISHFFRQVYLNSKISTPVNNNINVEFFNHDIIIFKEIGLLCYSLIYATILIYINLLKINNIKLSVASFFISVLFVILFLTIGLYNLEILKNSFINPESLQYFTPSGLNLGIRYISYLFLGTTIYAIYKNIKSGLFSFPNVNNQLIFDIILHGTILIILTTETLAWFSILRFSKSTQLSVSILLGLYSLFLISLGILKKRKHLRIGAIVLFAVTLIKLFFNDISHMGTITKTIVFVSLGILLLVISFLYNKFKHLIFDENED